jgi:hypothetical protein
MSNREYPTSTVGVGAVVLRDAVSCSPQGRGSGPRALVDSGRRTQAWGNPSAGAEREIRKRRES